MSIQQTRTVKQIQQTRTVKQEAHGPQCSPELTAVS